jgi:hypothetical protein
MSPQGDSSYQNAINSTLVRFYVGICVAIAGLLGSASIFGLYHGIIAGGGTYFQIAQSYGGFSLAILAFAFTESNVKQHPKRFLTFQSLFVLGIALVAPFIQSTPPFSTTTLFEVGSFSLLVAGFFITSNKEEYHNILLVSLAATGALFVGGMLSAFRDVSGTAVPTTGVPVAIPYVITALFPIGAFDLTILSTFLFRIVVVRIRKTHKPRLSSPYGLDPVA